MAINIKENYRYGIYTAAPKACTVSVLVSDMLLYLYQAMTLRSVWWPRGLNSSKRSTSMVLISACSCIVLVITFCNNHAGAMHVDFGVLIGHFGLWIWQIVCVWCVFERDISMRVWYYRGIAQWSHNNLMLYNHTDINSYTVQYKWACRYDIIL